MRVGAAQEVLAVEVLLGLDPRLVDAEEPGGGDAQEPLQSGLAGQAALDPAALGGGEAVGAVDELFELRDELRADGGVAFGLAGVVADDEPVMVVVAEADFLDLEVVPDFLVASLPRQGGLHVRGAGAELLPDDVPAAAAHQGAPVLLGGEAAVGDPDDLRQHPLAQVGLDLPDQPGIGGVPGPGPDPDGDPVAGDGHAGR